MLQIFEKGKAAALLGAEKEVPEDMLTAAVFGTLAYVECHTALEMLNAILGNESRITFPPAITKVTVELWPRDSSVPGEGLVEPDLLIDLFSEHDRLLRIIIESKWNGRLGPNQAIDQWKRFFGEAKETWHVFPVRDLDRIEQDLERQDSLLQSIGKERPLFADWEQCRRCISWYNIARSLRRFSHDIAGSPKRAHLHCWAQGVLSVLKFVGEKPFEGFGTLSPPTAEEHVTGSRVFWMGSRVREFDWPGPVEVTDVRPVFFKCHPCEG